SLSLLLRPPTPTPFPYTTLFRSPAQGHEPQEVLPDPGWTPLARGRARPRRRRRVVRHHARRDARPRRRIGLRQVDDGPLHPPARSEEHTSELQSRSDLVCRLLLE